MIAVIAQSSNVYFKIWKKFKMTQHLLPIVSMYVNSFITTKYPNKNHTSYGFG